MRWNKARVEASMLGWLSRLIATIVSDPKLLGGLLAFIVLTAGSVYKFYYLDVVKQQTEISRLNEELSKSRAETQRIRNDQERALSNQERCNMEYTSINSELVGIKRDLASDE